MALQNSHPPLGPVFFTSKASPRRKRRRTIFSLILVSASLALVWPIYPLFSGVRPFILGLPLSLAWVVLWLLIVLASLIWLFRTEHGDASSRDAHTQ